MNILCVIPARIGSTRLPRKPLSLLAGKPMVYRTYQGAKACSAFTKVVVATDSKEIFDIIADCGGEAVMTDSSIETGSDRVAFVSKQFPEMDVVVNLQGDEPFVRHEMLTALVQPYLNGERPVMTTIANPLDYERQYKNPDFVKVIVDKNFDALYFSRSPIPYQREVIENIPVYHHQGMYAFTREFLEKYTKLPQTPLELSEKLEQLRVLENGYKIRVCITPFKTLEINTPAELAEAQEIALKVWK